MQATCQLNKQLRQLVKKNQNNKQNRHPEIQGILSSILKSMRPMELNDYLNITLTNYGSNMFLYMYKKVKDESLMLL